MYVPIVDQRGEVVPVFNRSDAGSLVIKGKSIPVKESFAHPLGIECDIGICGIIFAESVGRTLAVRFCIPPNEGIALTCRLRAAHFNHIKMSLQLCRWNRTAAAIQIVGNGVGRGDVYVFCAIGKLLFALVAMNICSVCHHRVITGFKNLNPIIEAEIVDSRITPEFPLRVTLTPKKILKYIISSFHVQFEGIDFFVFTVLLQMYFHLVFFSPVINI